ncbi:hypothetical protein LTR99_002428 [Exophiala xenobiotica]|uniref:Uncharacterized protein n=1 Tax=Vermiconidia calcicola TaxID=1690605 RepID=A0AAV9QJV2_9PEZI|nr:hypothetical protein LTR96_002667 [Exophiala xenobiotica]KAK5541499.1 hypothetical protein LTR23_005821 [Chaetothyriales sp. CCFEE 6169]KAK5542235.1 hypothetical protein LTR25_002120 [Vermiconidia calcicola]KAK5306736.1 hypothetical protein LTR99_002428 [Exophiala xenobiotica]KAK5341285.1 hypothetical protein LTR98_002077 [Exophiala xenobiotica]
MDNSSDSDSKWRLLPYPIDPETMDAYRQAVARGFPHGPYGLRWPPTSGEHQSDDANDANDSSTEQGDDASTENTRPRRRFQLPDQSLTPTTPSEARFAARFNLYRDTIVQFGARDPWMQLHTAALARAEATIKTILTRLCYVAAVKNTAAPEIHARQALIRTHGRAAFANVQPHVLINHVEWIRFIGRFPTLVSQVMKHVKWVELLSGEYRKAEPVWALFWDRVEAGRDFGGDVMDQMAAMHKKRTFLQGKIVDGEAVLAILFSQEPMWLRWQVSGL